MDTQGLSRIEHSSTEGSSAHLPTMPGFEEATNTTQSAYELDLPQTRTLMQTSHGQRGLGLASQDRNRQAYTTQPVRAKSNAKQRSAGRRVNLTNASDSSQRQRIEVHFGKHSLPMKKFTNGELSNANSTQ